jgi:Holliday junction resolvase RusA-like endonuclease
MDVSQLDSITLILPLPPSKLNPNIRVHWAEKSRAVKTYRNIALFEAKKFLFDYDSPPLWAKAVVSCEAFFSHIRNRDEDNFQASMKAAFDGLADAGIVINDSGFTHMPPVFSHDKKKPRVEITITKKLQRIEDGC